MEAVSHSATRCVRANPEMHLWLLGRVGYLPMLRGLGVLQGFGTRDEGIVRSPTEVGADWIHLFPGSGSKAWEKRAHDGLPP